MFTTERTKKLNNNVGFAVMKNYVDKDTACKAMCKMAFMSVQNVGVSHAVIISEQNSQM